ncbi:MoaF-related domain-containing protein [Shewanella youngdeokensis]|uniref:MoaF-like domain-containing protein n=1 Tax=Shewanella youngdeokensis TaxID=2999068 RepID=A0ABZ0JV67_9GAMM|nr:hypothetical protein RGE70_12795 [Shewanella sp. DAU334]
MFKIISSLALALMLISGSAYSKGINITEQHLDGTTMNYFYQSGAGIEFKIHDGMVDYIWLTGKKKGNGNKNVPYRSRKIGNKMYIVNWIEESKNDFITLVFNFENNVMYSSGIMRFDKESPMTVFDGGIIQDLVLVEKQP